MERSNSPLDSIRFEQAPLAQVNQQDLRQMIRLSKKDGSARPTFSTLYRARFCPDVDPLNEYEAEVMRKSRDVVVQMARDESGKLIGWATVDTTDVFEMGEECVTGASLVSTYVNILFRKMGLGKKLVAKALDEARVRYPDDNFWAYPWDNGGKSFFNKCGIEHVKL